MPNGGNVIPLRPGRGAIDGDLPLPVEELTETVGVIGRCLAQISSEPEPATRPGRTTVTPFLLRMTMVEQQLEKLSSITVTTWPDVHWALRFCNARVRALSYIRESAASLQMARSCTEPPDAWGEDIRFVEMDAVSDALRDLRNLVVERYPETRPAY
jgi:hypothetical protein